LSLTRSGEEGYWKLSLQGELVSLYEAKKLVTAVSYNQTNLRFLESIILNRINETSLPRSIDEDDLLPSLELLLKEHNLLQIGDFKNFWQSLLNSFSLQSTLETYIKISAIHGFSTAICLIHPKGEANAWQLAPLSFANEMRPVPINEFNLLFQSLKKTKNKHFSSSEAKWSWLPLNGVFVADTFTYKKYNVIWINSREEFLPLTDTDHKRFAIFSRIMKIWLERLVELEFSDIKSSSVIWLIEHLPFEIVIKDSQDRNVFSNALFTEDNLGSMSWINLPRGYRLGYVAETIADDFEIDAFQKQKVLLLGDLFNTLRHELSNPLFGLRLSAELVLTSVDDEDFKLIFTQVLSNIQRSQNIIHNLSKLYSGEQTDTNVDLLAIIKESITLAKSELKGLYVDVSKIDFNQSITVEAKPVAVVQIIFNLIVNSAQAMKNLKEKAIIKISLELNSPFINVVIADNGPGLPATIKDNLFKPFYTTKTKGHGLGLALSKDLAIKLGGDLKYIPTEVGTQFELSLRKIL